MSDMRRRLPLLGWLRGRLSRRLLFSYLAVVAAGLTALAIAAEVRVPAAFARHLAFMSLLMGGPMLHDDLYANFRTAVSESLLFGALAAVVAAIIASLWMDRQITRRLTQLMTATRRLADGYLDERVPVVEAGAGDELTELGRGFNQMAAALERGEELRRELIGNVAHELRTPLATIRGHLEGLLDGVLPAEPATFELIHAEARRLETLVNDLQELSRVEAGAYRLNRQGVAPAELVRAVEERLRWQFQDKGVALSTQVEPGLPAVWVDPERIGQVLLNLLGNALQYTPAGGRVAIVARAEAGQVLISVTDTGIGIAPEHLPHIFTRFYRVDRSRARSGGGSGIGLTIARLLAEAHGGTVRAESAGEGQGSTFTLSLPAAR
jgi:two-component system sensor histidine kinase BaeS